MLKIIDVSEHQGRIDWARVKPYIDGTIIRCGLGSDDPRQIDKRFERNYAEVVRLDIPFEYYHYSYAKTAGMARSEAAHVLRLLKGKKVRRVWYDLEEHSCGFFAGEALRIFSDILRAAGYEVGLYTYESYYNSYLRGVIAWPIWCADYTNRPNIGVDYIAWQYTSSAKLPGITENTVDVSNWYGRFGTVEEEKPKSGQTKVFRLYRNNRHFYTVDESERDYLIANDWTFEGVGWRAPKNGHPVFRYRSGSSYLWTMDANERAALSGDGWTKEGIAFRSSVKKAVPVYRLYKDGDRVYTANKNELKALLKAGWRDEGIACFGRR